MGWQVTIWVVPLVVAAVINLGLFSYTVRKQTTRITRTWQVMLLFMFLWAAADAVRLTTTDLWLKLLANNVRFVSVTLITVAVLVLAIKFTNRDEWLTPARIAGLLVIPALTTVVAFTNWNHQLLRSAAAVAPMTLPVTGETVQFLYFEQGPWYAVHAIYSYLLMLVAFGMFLQRYSDRNESATYRAPAFLLFIGLVVPVGLNVPFALEVTPIDLTPFGLAFTGVVFTAAVYRYHVLDLVPIARSTVIENVESGVLVIDPQDRIVDVNRRVTALVGIDAADLRGQSLEAALGAYPALVDTVADGPAADERITIEREGEQRHFEVEVTPLTERGKQVGRVAVLRDVTETVETRRELERRRDELARRNERLDQFASVVSHDLRNPLGIAQTYLDFARSSGDEDDFAAVAEAHERMDALINSLLTIARTDATVEETESVVLATVASDAWADVATDGATLTNDLPGDRHIEADPDLLGHVFENLLRNAIDHNEPPVAVTVGTLPRESGFYVEDDGAGIPTEEREVVFEHGYTTGEGGSGFGLSLVTDLVDAHGWTIDIIEGSAGGARFEIRTGDNDTTA
jgi:PAS domain S-box-containing protein